MPAKAVFFAYPSCPLSGGSHKPQKSDVCGRGCIGVKGKKAGNKKLSLTEEITDDVKHILVLSSSTQDCCKAFHYGVSLARKYGVELFVLHVIHDPFNMEGWNLPIPYLRTLKEEQQKMREEIKKELDKIIASEKTRGMNITEFIKEGTPVDEVSKVVKEEKIDLMIMPAHEEGRLEHLLFSRDNEKIIREMPCSIFLVKHELF